MRQRTCGRRKPDRWRNRCPPCPGECSKPPIRRSVSRLAPWLALTRCTLAPGGARLQWGEPWRDRFALQSCQPSRPHPAALRSRALSRPGAVTGSRWSAGDACQKAAAAAAAAPPSVPLFCASAPCPCPAHRPAHCRCCFVFLPRLFLLFFIFACLRSQSTATTKRAGTSPVNAVVRETIMERQVHFQSSD